MDSLLQTLANELDPEAAARAGGGVDAPEHWEAWCKKLLPSFFAKPFADRHVEFWRWVDGIEKDIKPDAFVAIWGRGGAKSTNAEGAAVYVGAKQKRRYLWYVCETQDQADEHVASIGAMLETQQVERHYPLLASRKVGKYGSSRGWRRNRLHTANGFVVDAMGLDTARRGFRVEEQRPDMMIFDDIDGELDTPQTTEKKLKVIKKKLLPAGSNDLAVLMIQNLVIPNGVFARLSDGRADFLANRVVSGPHPAVADMQTENQEGRDVIIGGDATWEGQDLDVCQAQIDEWGLSAFLEEAQHEVYGGDGQIFLPEWWEADKNRFSIHDTGLANSIIARWQFWDTALKDKKTNDFAACATVELTRDYRLVLRDVFNERMNSAYLPEKMDELARVHNKDNKLRGVIIEDRGSGTTSIQTLRKSAAPWLADMIYEFNPLGSKEYRAKNAAVWCGRGMVWLPFADMSLDWYAPFLDDKLGQLFRFPLAENDDMVDTLVMAILYLEHYLSQGWHAKLGNMGIQQPQRSNGKYHDRIEKALKGRA